MLVIFKEQTDYYKDIRIKLNVSRGIKEIMLVISKLNSGSIGQILDKILDKKWIIFSILLQ